VTALGAATAENGGACLRLHSGQKAGDLGTATAVWLESALRHFNRLLLNLFAACNSFSVYLKPMILPNDSPADALHV
jgi:hypothetical protein